MGTQNSITARICRQVSSTTDVVIFPLEAARLKFSDPLIVTPIACCNPNSMPQVKRRENASGHPLRHKHREQRTSRRSHQQGSRDR